MSIQFQHILVTGGCGFIGSNFVRFLLANTPNLHVTNFDLITYSGNPDNLTDVVRNHGQDKDSRYHFIRGDICDSEVLSRVIRDSLQMSDRPAIDAVVHFAAETHVDRSIMEPAPFVKTNVLGTYNLIEICRSMLDMLPEHFRFIHVSTDEVYGSLADHDPPFTEKTPLAPNSPYAASKAASDLLVRSYIQTFDFPAVITRCSNNYGPYQFPEKLIPLIITNAVREIPVPIYGDGSNIRDWIHVDDHCSAVLALLLDGRLGACYNIGGQSELSNLEIARQVISALGKSESLISFVRDRPGHDQRYAMDIHYISQDANWKPDIQFRMGIQSTIEWYLENESWWRPLLKESGRVADTMYKP